MKILDRYLIKSFIVPFFVCVLIFCVLVVLGRFFDKMEIFVRFHAHLKDIVAFLVLGLPFWLNLVLPVATMLALLFSLGQLYQRGEFTAFRSAGIPSISAMRWLWRSSIGVSPPYVSLSVSKDRCRRGFPPGCRTLSLLDLLAGN